MPGILGGLYGILETLGWLLYAGLARPKNADRLPRPLVAITGGAILGGGVGLFLPDLKNSSGSFPAWPIAILFGIALTAILAVLDVLFADGKG